MNDPHKIGPHGAVFWITRQGDVCAECNKIIDPLEELKIECPLCHERFLPSSPKTKHHQECYEKHITKGGIYHEQITKAKSKTMGN